MLDAALHRATPRPCCQPIIARHDRKMPASGNADSSDAGGVYSHAAIKTNMKEKHEK
jgi:hypothetical protein